MKVCPFQTDHECWSYCALHTPAGRCALEVTAEAQQQTAAALTRIVKAMENPPSVEVTAASMAADMSQKNQRDSTKQSCTI